MARQLRYFTIEDRRNAVLSREMIALTGAAGNGSPQGMWVVAATTKVAAAARATEVIGRTFRSQQFKDASGSDVAAVIRAGLLQRDGDLVAWRQFSRDQIVVRTVHTVACREVETVAHWRMDRNNLNLVPVDRDPELLPTRPVAVAVPDTLRQYVSSDRHCNIYPGGVTVYNYDDHRMQIVGFGWVDREQAEELMRGLAGALAELEARQTRTGATS